jgi:hypothetical protein
MKNLKNLHITAILTLCIIGVIMIAIAQPDANPIVIYWKNEALQVLTGTFGRIFIFMGFIYALRRLFFILEENKESLTN